MKRASIFCWAGVLVFLLSLAAAASAQDAVAVITELKFNRGDIQLRASNSAAPGKPAVLQSLYAGNVVQTTKDAVAVIFFTDGSRMVTVDEKILASKWAHRQPRLARRDHASRKSPIC